MPKAEPTPPDSDWPRYSRTPFPRYRFVPGLNPHPRSHPEGHAYGQPDVRPDPWEPESWRSLETYRFGIDLFNYAYWWECHETLEGLWLVAGRTSVSAQFLQGIIQVSAAQLNRHLGRDQAARKQVQEGLARLEGAHRAGPVYMGVDLARFEKDASSSFQAEGGRAVRIRLEESR